MLALVLTAGRSYYLAAGTSYYLAAGTSYYLKLVDPDLGYIVVVIVWIEQ